MIVGSTFPLRLDFATCTRELSCILVPDPTLMLFTSPITPPPQKKEKKQFKIICKIQKQGQSPKIFSS
jgi:hypothetical protein